MSEHCPIAVVGGGLSGLMLARVLHVNGRTSSVFESDASAEGRVQGGQLDIHTDTGQAALHAAGLHEAFLRLVHPGGQATRVLSLNGKLLYSDDDDGRRDRPEVDRGELRRLLLDSLPAGTVRWGKKLIGIEARGGGSHALHFADDSVATCDLLVGGDGAWSKVRSLLSPVRPAYTGISFVECDVLDASRREPACAAVVGNGSLFALHPDCGILAHCEADGSLHLYVAVRAPQTWLSSIDFADAPAAKRAMLAQFEGWAPPLRALIERADGPLTPRPIFALPVGHDWERRPGVTLLGNAAHLMSPFAGEGANLALFDGAELGLALRQHGTDVEAALAQYEATLFPRAARAAAESADNLEILLGPQAPHGLVAMFSRPPPQ